MSVGSGDFKTKRTGRRINVYLIPSFARQASYGGLALHSFSDGGLALHSFSDGGLALHSFSDGGLALHSFSDGGPALRR